MSLSYAILGLLNYSEMTGYNLKKTFDGSLNFFWTAQTSQVYRELHKLERKSYVSHQIVHQEGKPNKKIFRITHDGKKAFLKWLAEYPLKEVIRDQQLVHLFFSAALDYETVKRELIKYIQDQELILSNIQSLEGRELSQEVSEEMVDDQFYWKLCVLKGKYVYKANIDWATEAIQLLSSKIKGV